MRIERVVLAAMIVGGLLAALGAQFLSHAHRQQLVHLLPTQPAASTTPSQDGTRNLTQPLYWNDPSLDPEVLKRAYPPTLTNPRARRHHQPEPIQPDRDEWNRLQRERKAVVY